MIFLRLISILARVLTIATIVFSLIGASWSLAHQEWIATAIFLYFFADSMFKLEKYLTSRP